MSKFSHNADADTGENLATPQQHLDFRFENSRAKNEIKLQIITLDKLFMHQQAC